MIRSLLQYGAKTVLLLLMAIPALAQVSGSLVHDGKTRTFQYLKPVECCEERPLVLVLHGGGGNATNANDPQWDGQWQDVANTKNFLVIFPEGKPEDGDPEAHWWNDCRSDESSSEPSYSDWDDVGFISALIDWAILVHGIDSRRVYVTGASNGGQMTYRLGLEANDRIAAIAPHVAQMAKSSECVEQSGRLPAYIHYGTSDPLTDPNGGCLSTPTANCARGEVISIFDSIAFWQAKNQAFTETSNQTIDPFASDGVSLTQRTFQLSPGQGWNDDHIVFVQAANDGGHWVPGPNPASVASQMIKGKKSRDITSAAAVYHFFERFSNTSSLDCGPGKKQITYFLGIDPEAKALPGGAAFIGFPGIEEGAENGPAVPDRIDTIYLVENGNKEFSLEVLTVDYANGSFDQSPILSNPRTVRNLDPKSLSVDQEKGDIVMTWCVPEVFKGGLTHTVYKDQKSEVVGFFTNSFHDLGGFAMGVSNEATTRAVGENFIVGEGTSSDAEIFLRLAEDYTGVALADARFSQEALTLFQVGVTLNDGRERAHVNNEEYAFVEGNKVYRTRLGGSVQTGPAVNAVYNEDGTAVYAPGASPPKTNRTLMLDDHLKQTLNFHSIDGIKQVIFLDGIGEADIDLGACVNGRKTLVANAVFNTGNQRTTAHNFQLYENGMLTNTWAQSHLETTVSCAGWELHSFKRSAQGNRIPGAKYFSASD